MTPTVPPHSTNPPRPLTPADLLLHSTTRIACEYSGGSAGTGTGFFFRFANDGGNFVVAIVTNKHVVQGATRGQFLIHAQDEYGRPAMGRSHALNFTDFEQRWASHPDPDVDLCAMPISGVLNRADAEGMFTAYTTLDVTLIPSAAELETLSPFEEVVMVGYPIGLWDSTNNRPIVRRGITATHPGVHYCGRPEFLIDAACFPGSSGSPVLLFQTGGYSDPNGTLVLGGSRIRLLGVLYAGPQHRITGELEVTTIPTNQSVVPVSAIPINLGLVIQSGQLLHFEELFTRLLAAELAAVAMNGQPGTPAQQPPNP